jgi:RNA polymerase sigma-70 factor (ECF subfamily)
VAWPTGKSQKREGFAREAMTHIDHLYRVALHLAKEQSQAQDLVQETYVRALGAQEQFTPGTNLKAWLTRILYNFFFDHYQQTRKWVSVEQPNTVEEEGPDFWERIASASPGPESSFLEKEMRTKISEALAKIPETFRTPILLVDMGDFSYAEAAEILSCPVGTVRSRLSRGRKLMHKLLRGYLDVHKETEKK